jgi:hypothetical protein
MPTASGARVGRGGHAEDIARRVRAAAPGLPAASAKIYLGTVTMRPDRTLDVVIEYHEGVRLALERSNETWSVAAAQRVTAPGRE